MSAISLTHGPGLVGIFLACMLYGAMVIQAFHFFTHFNNDRLWLKAYVCLLVFVDTISTVFAIWWIYNLLINNFGNLDAFAVADWLLAADPALVGITGTLCQLFFTYRIMVLTRRKWLGYTIAALSLASGLCAIGSGVAVDWVRFLADFDNFQIIGCLWLGLTALVDVLITTILTSFLNKQRTGFRRTEQLLRRIVRATIANGLVTSIFAITEIILYVVLPKTGLHIAFSFILPKLYCNSVMSSLNMRRADGDSTTAEDHLSANIPQTRDLSQAGTQQATHPDLFIQVQTEQHEMYDLNRKNKWLEDMSSQEVEAV